MEKPERPNTISGLMSKRAEFIKRHAELLKEAKRLSSDIDTLEATIKLFGGDIATLKRVRRRIATRPAHGMLQRFVLDKLREAGEPLTSLQLAKTFGQERRLAPDRATTINTRKRVGACLYHLSTKGLVVAGAGDGDYKGWQIKRT